MMALVLMVVLVGPDPTYAEISKKHGLGAADHLMREGKFLEAAVAYRNRLLEPGAERESVRIPLALALLARGDAVYAGIEIRRAHTLYPEFGRLVIDPAELFGQKGVLSKAADSALKKAGETEAAEVDAVVAYAFCMEGDRDRAQAALERYVQSRGADAYSRDLRELLGKGGVPPRSRLAGAAAPSAPSPVPVRSGEVVRVGIRFIEPESRPRAEILSK
jgi:hypothetical protein